jgi:hypothetical protein
MPLEDRTVPATVALHASDGISPPPTTAVEGAQISFEAIAGNLLSKVPGNGFEFQWTVTDANSNVVANADDSTPGQLTDFFNWVPLDGGITSPYTVSVHVIEQGNGANVADASVSVSVGDAALHITKSADISGAVEGTATNFVTVANFTDDNSTALASNNYTSDYTATIYWGDGSTDVATFADGTVLPNGDIQGAHAYAQEGTYYIGVLVQDVDGSSVMLNGTDQFSTNGTKITVGDAAPTVTANNPAVTAPSNMAATNAGTFADFDDAVTITASQGNIINQSAGNSGSWSWSQSGLPVGGPYTVTITATNADGLTATTSFTVTVSTASSNHPPVITGPGPTVAVLGQSVPYMAMFTDADATDTHTATIDWGDSSTPSNFVFGAGGAGTINGAHTYTAPGNFVISV